MHGASAHFAQRRTYIEIPAGMSAKNCCSFNRCALSFSSSILSRKDMQCRPSSSTTISKGLSRRNTTGIARRGITAVPENKFSSAQSSRSASGGFSKTNWPLRLLPSSANHSNFGGSRSRLMLPVKQFSHRLRNSSEFGRFRKFKLPESTLSDRLRVASFFGRAVS